MNRPSARRRYLPTPSPTSPAEGEGEGFLIKRGRIDSFLVYEVKDSELDNIESEIRDAPLHLTYSTTLLSASLTGIGTIATANFKWQLAELVFVGMVIVGLVGGSYFLFRWKRTQRKGVEVLGTIRNRIKNGSSRS